MSFLSTLQTNELIQTGCVSLLFYYIADFLIYTKYAVVSFLARVFIYFEMQRENLISCKAEHTTSCKRENLISCETKGRAQSQNFPVQ